MSDIEPGSTILQSLDRALSRLRTDMLAVDRTVQSSSAELLAVGDAVIAAYRRLAELRLEHATRGGVVRGLEAVSARVREALERREAAIVQVGRELAEAQSALAPLEAEREQQRGRVQSASAILDERQGAVQARLADAPQYREQLERAERADAMADEAEKKTADAERDRAAKGAPYESDSLFMYLWRRGYGTSKYAANPLARALDGWVARRCGFARARPNYWMLLEIPVRLRAHAERQRAGAAQEFARLEALERTAAGEAGVPLLEQTLDAEERALDELDSKIAAAEQQTSALLAQRAAFAAGEDDGMRNALEILAAELRSEGIEALRRQAAATPSEEDDRLVTQIEQADDERERLEAALAQHKIVHTRHGERVRELELVRRQFKERRYDDVHSVFMNGALVALAVDEFLRGVIGGDDLWTALRRHQRFREMASRPYFGTGGFPRHRGTWRMPRSGGWNMPRMPRGGGFGGGGFRTGGGFGRGGFRTGGGF